MPAAGAATEAAASGAGDAGSAEEAKRGSVFEDAPLTGSYQYVRPVERDTRSTQRPPASIGFTADVLGEAIGGSAVAPGRMSATSGAGAGKCDATAALEVDMAPPDRIGLTAVNEPSASSRGADDAAVTAALGVDTASPGRIGFSVKATGLLLGAEATAACTGAFAAARRRNRKKTRSASRSRNPPPAPAPIKTIEFEGASDSPPGGSAATG